ncbi:hypothetical protein N8I77_006182 [Diaporthe amygdali]|uniref:Uncharacterized protein n=1 Tax=Phomopsis amygdali TaxID=1214568 RepID=A0AAD9SG58_PHOAM|nr:metal tolerance protein 3 [Diaporthe amygdali]KAJ0125202.1 metal tolerance protein 3 [Diaporthe amygdali]KAK2607516.1 hypothetical protein N8I77_006182 [Diaporthe amygdali]
MQSPLTTAILLLATLSAAVFASPASGITDAEGSVKVVRQFTGTILSTQAACLQYSQIANMSVIGGNSSYRTTFLEQSPVGTLANSAMLNKAILVAPNLTADAELNQACGNLTAIAIQEAATNFTKGIVAQFTFTGNPASVVNGPIIAVVVILCLLIQVGPLTAL